MSDYELDIEIEADAPEEAEALLAAAVNAALSHQDVAAPATLSLLLADDRRIQELNRQYRDVDAPTDVLSFPAGDPMPGMEALPLYLGDIVVSVPYAARQAEASGHSVTAELQLLTVHGVLHLLGHDHGDSEEKGRMWQAQSEILDSLGLSSIQPTEAPHA